LNPSKLFLLTAVAMIAFAGNSLLCRLALKETRIDPASFTFVRIVSGAAMLWLIFMLRKPKGVAAAVHLRNAAAGPLQGNWPSALALFAYAAAFSFAYVSLSAATGALLLFGAVQATMILWGIGRGEQLRPRQLLGLVLALCGLVALLLPGISAPPFAGSILMLGAGIAWGVYSLRGRTAGEPTAATTGNFLRAVPFAALLALAFLSKVQLDRAGLGYALLSGAVASGVGYVIWYTVLPALKAASAATVQLSVPVLTAAGGILLLGEPLTLRFFLSSIAVLGGIALVVLNRSRR